MLCQLLETHNYIHSVWKHNIIIDVAITETGRITFLIQDEGEENKFIFHEMSARSEGARHFLSLILSVSLESHVKERSNELIIIDEPELHLHPSGIRDLRDELIKMGEKNFVFISTHSPFLVDKRAKERNILVWKNKNSFTNIREIDEYSDILDDEVLSIAFGLSVYKDLLNPHRILVEGASDKKIFNAILSIGKNPISITNGYGGNIYAVATLLNNEDISLLTIVDDDKEGQKYKEKIISIGGSYTDNNVFSLRDLVHDLPVGATIEDMLGEEFIKSCFTSCYKKEFNGNDIPTLNLTSNKPFLKTISTTIDSQKLSISGKDFNSILKIGFIAKLKLPKTLFKLEEKFPKLHEIRNVILKKLN